MTILIQFILDRGYHVLHMHISVVVVVGVAWKFVCYVSLSKCTHFSSCFYLFIFYVACVCVCVSVHCHNQWVCSYTFILPRFGLVAALRILWFFFLFRWHIAIMVVAIPFFKLKEKENSDESRFPSVPCYVLHYLTFAFIYLFCLFVWRMMFFPPFSLSLFLHLSVFIYFSFFFVLFGMVSFESKAYSNTQKIFIVNGAWMLCADCFQ